MLIWQKNILQMSVQQYNPTVVSHSIHIVCVLMCTVLVSDVKQPYQMMLAKSTELVSTSAVQPPTTMS